MNPRNFTVINRYAVAAMIAEHIAAGKEVIFELMEGTPILYWEDFDLVEYMINNSLVAAAVQDEYILEHT